MTHRPRGDYGYQVGMEATWLGIGTGVMLARAHEEGIASLQRHLDVRRQALEEAQQAVREGNVRKLEALSHSLADEVLRLRADADKLRRLLEQRQAVIDGMRKP